MNASVHRNPAADFRALAENADVVERIIATSTDATPATRRRCLLEIAAAADAADLAEVVAEAEVVAPRILAALAALDDEVDPTWLVTIRIQLHPDDLAIEFARHDVVSITQEEAP